MNQKRTYYFGLILFCSVFFMSGQVSSQVKIGNNPDSIKVNSLLEMEHDSKGILIPRVTLDDASTAAPLSAPIAEGTMIYNDSGSAETGFYFWNGTQWSQLISSENSDTRDNYVLVKTASDLPTAVGGVITLAANSVYEINGTIVTSNKIDPNGSYIIGENANTDRLIYTGTGAFITSNLGLTIKTVTLAAITAGSQVFDLDDLSGSNSVVIRDCIIANSISIGTIANYNIALLSIISYTGNFSGITYENIEHLFLLNQAWFSDNFGTYETFTGTFENIQKNGGYSDVELTNAATAMDISGVTSLIHGSVLGCAFIGTGTFVSGTFAKQWEVESTGIDTEKDDVAQGNIYITGSTTTSISLLNTPTKVLGTTSGANLFRFTSTTDNRLTYDGTKTRKFKVTCAVSMTSPANNKEYSFYVAKNGSVLQETVQKRKIGSGADVGSLALHGLVELAPGDYIEVWVENNTDATDISVIHMNLSVN